MSEESKTPEELGLKRYKSWDEVAKAYKELEKKLSASESSTSKVRELTSESPTGKNFSKLSGEAGMYANQMIIKGMDRDAADEVAKAMYDKFSKTDAKTVEEDIQKFLDEGDNKQYLRNYMDKFNKDILDLDDQVTAGKVGLDKIQRMVDEGKYYSSKEPSQGVNADRSQAPSELDMQEGLNRRQEIRSSAGFYNDQDPQHAALVEEEAALSKQLGMEDPIVFT